MSKALAKRILALATTDYGESPNSIRVHIEILTRSSNKVIDLSRHGGVVFEFHAGAKVSEFEPLGRQENVGPCDVMVRECYVKSTAS